MHRIVITGYDKDGEEEPIELVLNEVEGYTDVDLIINKKVITRSIDAQQIFDLGMLLIAIGLNDSTTQHEEACQMLVGRKLVSNELAKVLCESALEITELFWKNNN